GPRRSSVRTRRCATRWTRIPAPACPSRSRQRKSLADLPPSRRQFDSERVTLAVLSFRKPNPTDVATALPSQIPADSDKSNRWPHKVPTTGSRRLTLEGHAPRRRLSDHVLGLSAPPAPHLPVKSEMLPDPGCRPADGHPHHERGSAPDSGPSQPRTQ